MTLEEIIRLRTLINLLSPYDFDPAIYAVINEALRFYTDWNQLNACVQHLITVAPSRSFATRLQNWLNSVELQEIVAA